jgi:hypothetical protein
VTAAGPLLDTRSVEYLAERLAAVPGVVAVTLGGSRAVGAAVEGSDWDFGLYYRGGLDPADISALGWPGRVFAPGEWGSIVNGGAWLTVDGARVDVIYRDLDEVLRWTAAAGEGRFEIRREVGYVAGIATYILAGELALGQVLAGELPRPAFPPRLRETAPAAWFRLAAGALSFAKRLSISSARNRGLGCWTRGVDISLAGGWIEVATQRPPSRRGRDQYAPGQRVRQRSWQRDRAAAGRSARPVAAGHAGGDDPAVLARISTGPDC